MKKSFKIFAVAIMACAAVISCKKNDDNKTNDQGGEDVATESIEIDGNFADWDACTSAVSAKLPEGATDKALKEIKFTSDADYIYGYAEFENVLATIEGVDPTWDGNTWAGKIVPSPFCILLDCDNNPKTGMIFKAASSSQTNDGLFTNIGFEVGLDLYQFVSVETGKVTLGWSQCNQFDTENAEDGDAYGTIPPQKWGDDGLGNRDNTLVLKSDYASKISGATIKVEFAIGRSALYETAGQSTINISAVLRGYPWSIAGYLPQGGSKEYITLNLK